MYTLTVQAYYDKCLQNYINIIRINIIPEGPLKFLVRKIKLYPVSSFDYNSFNYNNNNNHANQCAFALISFNGNRYMSPNEIPDLFSFLSMNGYKIDTSITKMMNTSDVRIDNQNILCFFSYKENNRK
jgi:hypothetical protein